MSLTSYKKKRNFKETPEPEGKPKSSVSKLSFVIQRHKASRLHYDFRLEMDGVLKSWAVPKGPSLNPEDKRLAMMVEDHPYDYKDFAGIIPEGNYGAGIVEIWDSGYYSDLENSDKKSAEKKLKTGLKSGNLKFRLYGKKLRGEFALIKIKNRSASEKDNTWLLIKHSDEFSVDEDYNSEEYTEKNSPINKWLIKNKPSKAPKAKLPGQEAKKKNPKKYLPAATRKLKKYIAPMLAKETDAPFDNKDWIFEIKWDGYRAVAEVSKENVLLYSRNGNSFNESYPAIIDALKKLRINAVLDGEIVALDEDGAPSFQLLQIYSGEYALRYCVFDVLSVNGKELYELPLIKRKERLKKLLKKNDSIEFSDHIEERGIDFFEAVGEQNIEGIIAKKTDSLYRPGTRTGNWLKIKHHRTQEAIIAGYTEPGGSRRFFGSLVLGRLEGKQLVYFGHTGTGFNAKSLKKMYDLLKPLIQKKSPFNEKVKTNTAVTWVKPQLVCEVKFSEITRDGKLRHPVFLHVRDDKDPSGVTAENSKIVKHPAEKKEAVKGSKRVAKKVVKKAKAEKGSQDISSADEIIVDGIPVKVSHRDKIYWPDEKITKGEMIEYYLSVSEYIMPYLTGRPQSLKRNPNGITNKGFFHKDAGEDAPEYVESIKIYSDSSNKDINYILCNNKASLIYLNNLGCIEINPWHSTTDALDYPDYLMIDLDPSENNTFDQVVEAALAVKEVLEIAGIEGYCKTSGASGLHVYVPTGKKYTYEQVKDFTNLICMLVNERLPGFTTLERNLSKRGKNKIYLDYLQNRRGQTISCAYSLRPKKGAPVSMPLKWSEVEKGISPLDFTIYNALDRIKKTGDIFRGVLGRGINLEKSLQKLQR